MDLWKRFGSRIRFRTSWWIDVPAQAIMRKFPNTSLRIVFPSWISRGFWPTRAESHGWSSEIRASLGNRARTWKYGAWTNCVSGIELEDLGDSTHRQRRELSVRESERLQVDAGARELLEMVGRQCLFPVEGHVKRAKRTRREEIGSVQQVPNIEGVDPVEVEAVFAQQ